MKKNIRTLSQESLIEEISRSKFPAYRARQLYEWLWKKNILELQEMTNLPKSFRAFLKENYSFPKTVVDFIQKSTDGTMKFQLKLHDHHLIEAVLIPVVRDRRFTVCLSSQVGCSLSCKFCATGTMPRHRNLLAAEIMDQYHIVNAHCIETFGHRLTNVVYMGMGEPLLNFSELTKSIDVFCDTLELSPKRLTVSTAGISKMIRKLADHGRKLNLALSLHAATDDKRNEIMAINEKNNLQGLIEALQYFYEKLKTKISFEYILLKGFNDSIQDAKHLAKLTRKIPVRINIIEYNTVSVFDWEKSSEDQLERFARRLMDDGCLVTVRRSRGKDIDAACGQLAIKSA